MSSFQEEPGLFDVAQPLVRSWKVILVGVLAGMLAAAGFSFLAPKEYETSVPIQVGAILDKQIEETFTVVDIINSDSFRQVVASRMKVSATPKQLRKMIRAETNQVRSSSIVTVTVISDSAEHAVQLAKTVADVLIERHQPMFDDKLAYFSSWAKELESKIDDDDQQVKAMKDDLKKLETERGSELASILMLESRLSDREMLSVSWRKDLREYLALRSIVHTHNTAMVAPPVLPSKPSSPNLILNVAVAFCVSLFLMTSVVLILDQYRKASLRI